MTTPPGGSTTGCTERKKGAALGELDDVIYQGEKTTDLAAAKAELDRMSPEAYAVKGFGSSIACEISDMGTLEDVLDENYNLVKMHTKHMTEYMVAEIWEDEDGEQVIGDGLTASCCRKKIERKKS